MKNIKTTFENWGAQKRHLPTNSAEVLDRVINSTSRTPVPTPSRSWRIPRLAVGFAIIALVAFFGQSLVTRQLVTADVEESYSSVAPMSPQLDTGINFGTAVGLSALSTSELKQFIAPIIPQPDYYPYRRNDTPITDTRELLETSYSARVKTRKVAELGARLQTIIRGFGGRIDSSSLSERYGHIAFVVPEGKLDALRNELSGMVWKRFFSESVSSENQLNEQRTIEDSKKSATNELAWITDQRAAAKKKFDAREASLNAQIGRLTATLRTLTEQRTTATTDDVRAGIDAQIKTNDRNIRNVRATLTKTRAEYDQELRNFDIYERQANERLDGAKSDEQSLAGRVATVRGTISLEQLSYTRIATTFVAGHWIAILFALLAILAFRRMDRRPLID